MGVTVWVCLISLAVALDEQQTRAGGWCGEAAIFFVGEGVRSHCMRIWLSAACSCQYCGALQVGAADKAGVALWALLLV